MKIFKILRTYIICVTRKSCYYQNTFSVVITIELRKKYILYVLK